MKQLSMYQNLQLWLQPYNSFTRTKTQPYTDGSSTKVGPGPTTSLMITYRRINNYSFDKDCKDYI